MTYSETIENYTHLPNGTYYGTWSGRKIKIIIGNSEHTLFVGKSVRGDSTRVTAVVDDKFIDIYYGWS